MRELLEKWRDLMPLREAEEAFRWLWDRGLAMYTTAIIVILGAVLFEAFAPEAAPEWLTALATTAGGAIFVRAALRAGPGETENSGPDPIRGDE